MKKIILVYIIGLLMGIGFTAGASLIYNASDIDFTPSDSSWNVNNVSDAIKDLKNTEDNIVKLNVGQTKVASYEGNLYKSKQISMNLDKGKYLVYATLSYANKTTTIKNELNENYEISSGSRSLSVDLSCDDNCTAEENYKWSTTGTGLTTYISGYYLYDSMYIKSYNVDVLDDSTITLKETWDEFYNIGTILQISATKIAD